MRGRGGGVEDVLYENLEGSVIAGIQLTENYAKGTKPTNVSATPGVRNSTRRPGVQANVFVRVFCMNVCGVLRGGCSVASDYTAQHRGHD